MKGVAAASRHTFFFCSSHRQFTQLDLQYDGMLYPILEMCIQDNLQSNFSACEGVSSN
jgi:hypothetical protein